VTDASVQEKIPTWRYYFNATIANMQPKGYPTLGAFHGADLDMIFGTYPTVNATEQQVALSAFMQTAWATFAKDPKSGPGWKASDGTSSDEVACLGCEGSSGLEMIPVSVIDARCEQYASLLTASTPAF
jgi:carboxylesterase type B